MQPPDMIRWLSPLDIPFPSFSSHLLPAVAVGADLTDLSSITSQSCTTPPNMPEMTWTGQVNVKHLDFLRSIRSERTLVFSQRSTVRMSVFESSVVFLFSLQCLLEQSLCVTFGTTYASWPQRRDNSNNIDNLLDGPLLRPKWWATKC